MTLRGYLKELSYFLTTTELRTAEEYMNRCPLTFRDLYNQTKQAQLQELQESCSHKPVTNQSHSSVADETFRELGDVALFLLTVYSRRYESSKYVKDPAALSERLMSKKQDPLLLL